MTPSVNPLEHEDIDQTGIGIGEINLVCVVDKNHVRGIIADGEFSGAVFIDQIASLTYHMPVNDAVENCRLILTEEAPPRQRSQWQLWQTDRAASPTYCRAGSFRYHKRRKLRQRWQACKALAIVRLGLGRVSPTKVPTKDPLWLGSFPGD